MQKQGPLDPSLHEGVEEARKELAKMHDEYVLLKARAKALLLAKAITEITVRNSVVQEHPELEGHELEIDMAAKTWRIVDGDEAEPAPTGKQPEWAAAMAKALEGES